MDIATLSALGSSAVSALTSLQSVGSSATAGDPASSSVASASDTVSISSQGQWAARAQDGGSFKTDLANLGNLIQSGDLDGAKQAFAAMKAKMKGHHHHDQDQDQDQDSSKGTLATDFAALGTALASGDANAAKSALTALQTDLDTLKASQLSAAGTAATATGTGTPASSTTTASGSNPFKTDLEQLGTLLDAGDLSGAQALFKTMAEKLKNGPPPPSSGTSGTSSVTSAFSALATALNGNDASAAKDAWSTLQSTLAANAPAQPAASTSGQDLDALLLAYRLSGGQPVTSAATS